jgi:cytoskeletal protein CcmA (bactofilin family)
MALFRKDRDRGGAKPPIDETSFAPQPRNAPETSAAPESRLWKEKDNKGSHMASGEKLPGGGEQLQANAFLGKGTRITGKVCFEGPARIEGQVEGEIVANEALLIGESAVLNAQITGNVVVINGKVSGDITASKKLEIRTPGRFYGNVITPSLVIEEGVVFEGHCSMGAAETKLDRKVTLLAKEEKPSENLSPVPFKAQAEGK